MGTPLPEYYLYECFSPYGGLEYVRLQKDKNYGYVKVCCEKFLCAENFFAVFDRFGCADCNALFGWVRYQRNKAKGATCHASFSQ
jgi:hypothetical protein